MRSTAHVCANLQCQRSPHRRTDAPPIWGLTCRKRTGECSRWLGTSQARRHSRPSSFGAMAFCDIRHESLSHSHSMLRSVALLLFVGVFVPAPRLASPRLAVRCGAVDRTGKIGSPRRQPTRRTVDHFGGFTLARACRCIVCQFQYVPEVLLATIELPPNIPVEPEAQLIQARIYKPKRRSARRRPQLLDARAVLHCRADQTVTIGRGTRAAIACCSL